MLRLVVCVVVTLIIAPQPSVGQFVAERITLNNAANRLFGGTDADGGIGDWYVSNGVIEAIIDDVGPQEDLVPLLGDDAPQKASEFGFAGGSVIDFGLVGADNDQLSQLFTVGGLSTTNFIIYDTVSATRTSSSATITVSGPLLGFDASDTPVDPSNLPVVTQYTVTGGAPFLTITTTVTNKHPKNPAVNLGGFLDAIIWTIRAVVPFSPLPERGFNHPVPDFSSTAALALAIELPTFSAGPGNITPADGIIDPTNGTTAGEASYGLLGGELIVDQDGPGGNPAVVTPVNTLFGISSTLVTALGNLPGGSLQPGGTLTYTRRLYVANRNDVASVANPMIAELGSRLSFSVGTISGDVDAVDTPDVAASVIATRTGGGAVGGLQIGAPITQFRTDQSGAFSGIVLPAGVYDLEFRSAERDPVAVSDVTVSADADTVVSVPDLSAVGSVELTVLEVSPNLFGVPIPSKVTFKGLGGTPDPNFRHDFDALALPLNGDPIDLLPETFAGGPAQRNFVYLVDGVETVQLRPGRYELLASCGPEYTVARRRIKIKEGRTRKSKLKIRRIVDTSGFLSGDFHIHSARSMDTAAGLRDRVAAFAGEGVQVMVSTDHDYHVDYSTIIAGLGLDDRMTSIVGNEVTTSTPNPPLFPDALGHINAWPLSVRPLARRDGAIEDEFVAPNMIYSRLRNQGAEVIQYNHPRAGVSGLTTIGFFNNIGYDPELPITASPNNLLLDDDVLGPGLTGVSNPDGLRNLDFDVMEIGNGTDIPDYIAVRRDWFSLLNQTDFETIPFIGGTGVSDSHRVTMESAGYFRTYVGGAGDDPTSLNATAFDNNIKAGNMMATTGPFVDFSIEDGAGSSAGLGQIFVPADENLLLRIRVQATNWIPVEEVRVYANGFLSLSFDENTSPKVERGPKNPRSKSTKKVIRFEAEIPVAVAADTYFVVEAGAKLSPLPTPDPFVATIVPSAASSGTISGMIPLGFTNPIFVDLAGDGFDPPGLPVMASASGANETAPAYAHVRRLDEPMWTRATNWWHRAMAAVEKRGAVIADEQEEALTGTALQADIERRKSKPTADYFPLYRFSIPQEAVDQALERVSEPERSRIRALREEKR